jgi:hypothetical protein
MFKHKISQNLKIALKGKREIKVSVLRMLLAAILNKEKEKRYRLNKENPDLGQEELEKESELTEEEITSIISIEAKKRKEAIVAFEKGERKDLAEKEKKELDILKKYLPEQLSEEELYQTIKQVIAETGAKEIKDMGKVMKEVMPRVVGRAHGNQVSDIVKELLKND